MNTCQNCGHDCHCGSNCTVTTKDGDDRDITIVCCNNCRHKEKE